MTPRTLAILLVCAIVSSAAAAFAIAQRVSFQETDFQGQRVFPDLVETAKDVTTMTVTQSGTVMTFEKNDAGWTLKQSGNYQVHDNLVSKVVFGLANMELLDTKTAMPSRFKDLQLSDPSDAESKAQQVKLTDANGSVIADLIVGRANYFLPETTTGGMYIRRPGEDQTWLARGLVDIGVEPRDWLIREIIDIKPEQVARVDVVFPDGTQQAVVPAPDATGGFAYDNMPDGFKLKSPYAPRNVAAVLGSFVLNNVTPSADINLDPALAYVATFKTTDGMQVVTRMWEKDGQHYLRIQAEAAPPSAAATQAAEINARTNGWTYIIPDYQYQQISKKLTDVIEKATTAG
tara:strand:- start:9239 stop:10279 length:1041 start_codon:yes stop_codon:yes gene_type:complete